jgi:hypothetical protein
MLSSPVILIPEDAPEVADDKLPDEDDEDEEPIEDVAVVENGLALLPPAAF